MSIYIDVDKAAKWNRLGKVKVYLNGKLVKEAIAAKSGNKGFVESFTGKINKAKDALVMKKQRGVVKISFQHELK